MLCFIILMMHCKKAGPGGKADVSVYVRHHHESIPGATVYVKYNEKEFPGADPEKYDLSVVCGITGHSEGHAPIMNLRPGYYYFYAEGFDSTISQKVSGGTGLHIKHSQRKKEI